MTRWIYLLAGVTLSAQATEDNPHGNPEGCLSCHAPADDGEEGVGAPLPIVATCRGCHPTADMHPVGIAPVDIQVPSHFPLEDGKLTCATCHVETAHGGEAAKVPPPWHRGGPYPNLTDLCFQCHVPADYKQVNPHANVAAFGEDGPDTNACTACHTSAPAGGAAPEQSNLRNDGLNACSTCHEGTVHAGVPQHLGQPIPEGTSLPADLPLWGGQVACFSCHDVHGGHAAGGPVSVGQQDLQAAARASDWHVVPAGALWPAQAPDDAKAMLYLPLQGNALCSACHGDGP